MGLDATGQPEHRDAQDTATRTPQAAKKDQDAAKRIFVPPEPLQGQYRQLYAYLTQQRGIPPVGCQEVHGVALLAGGEISIARVTGLDGYACGMGLAAYHPER